MLLQSHQQDFRVEKSSKKFSTLRYQDLRTLTQSFSSLVFNCHTNLEIKATFMCLILLKPRPPASLGAQMLLYALRQSLCVFWSCFPHQKLLINAFTLWHSTFGSRYICIAQVGIVCAIELTKTPLPTKNNILPFQLTNLLFTLYMMAESNVSFI